MKNLKDLYQNHFGKVTQKWSIYFDQYEEKLRPYKELPIKFFEIGIENGGSLEIFSKYFLNAELILGCDINHDCAKLEYEKPNTKVVIGDANKESIKNEIIKYSKFDIIIDDGLHAVSANLNSLIFSINSLRENGVFVVEDIPKRSIDAWLPVISILCDKYTCGLIKCKSEYLFFLRAKNLPKLE